MKIILIVLAVIVIFAIVLLAGIWSMFGTKITASKSVKKLEDGLYWLEFIGDYGFDGYLAQGGAASDSKMAEYIVTFLSNGFVKSKGIQLENKDFGCSTLVVKNTLGGQFMGRNYDWEGRKSDAMIIHTKPDNGYESFSTCCLNFLGFGDDWKPEGMQNQYMSLAAIYVPLDGINEKGLCVADLICGDQEETHQTTQKINLTTTSAIRLLLDKAANVEEAITLLKQYNMHSSIGTAHHLTISDESGKSVVVEYVNNEMTVMETPIVTNHYLCPGEKCGVGNEESHVRFDKLMSMYTNAKGAMTAEEVKESIKEISYPDITQWSIVFDTQNRSLDFYWQRKFDNTYEFKIDIDGT